MFASRPLWLRVLLWCTAVVVLITAGVCTWAMKPNDDPQLQGHPYVETTFEATPTEPQDTIAEPTPAATRSTTPPVPTSESSSCQQKGDKSGSDCEEKKTSPTFEEYYKNNPAYECKDGRNQGLGPGDEQSFVPCVNGTLRLEISQGTGNITLYTTTTQHVEIKHHAPLNGGAEPPNMATNGLDWLIWQTENEGDDQPFFRVGFFNNPDLAPFATYIRPRGVGEWEYVAEPHDMKYYTSMYYQVVVFWNDPAKAEVDAPLPPIFSWKQVRKNP